MRTRIRGTNNFKTTLSRILMGLICLSLIGGISVVTASGDDRGRGPGDRGRDRGRVVERRGPDRDRFEHGRRVYRPYYGYREPVYAPPPVIYEPPSPGISFFFPPIIIR